MIYQSAKGAAGKAAYDVSGGSWSSAVTDYNPAGIKSELETNYTAINQLFNGQAQGWIGQGVLVHGRRRVRNHSRPRECILPQRRRLTGTEKSI